RARPFTSARRRRNLKFTTAWLEIRDTSRTGGSESGRKNLFHLFCLAKKAQLQWIASRRPAQVNGEPGHSVHRPIQTFWFHVLMNRRKNLMCTRRVRHWSSSRSSVLLDFSIPKLRLNR